jgi:hypothetical protein
MRTNARTLLPVLSMFLVLCGCTVIGRGQRTIIRAPCPEDNEAAAAACAYASHHYPNLVYSGDGSEPQRVLLINGDGAPQEDANSALRQQALESFHKYLTDKYGHPNFRAAQVSFDVHDRNTAPALLPYDVTQLVATSLATLITSNPKLAAADVTNIQASLQTHLRDVADLPQVTVWHHNDMQTGARVYYYYPRISLDFSAQFPSTSTYDRLSYLALVVRLKQAPSDTAPRFLDFAPKSADLASFSRGTFTQATQAQAQIGYGGSSSTVKTIGAAPSVTATTNGTTTTGPSLSLSNSDTYADTLADTVERRTMGILDQGQTFFADLRAVREVRIAGTYNFDLMFEVPSTIETFEKYNASKPVVPEIKADVYLIGVVRHVFKRGTKGFITRVPETENDLVYEQVLLKVLPDQQLWKFYGEYFAKPKQPPKAPTVCKIKVVTNRDDASFILEDGDGRANASASGKEAVVELKPMKNGDWKGRIVFLPIISSSDEKGAQVLAAKPAQIEGCKPDSSILVKGEYLPQRVEEGNNKDRKTRTRPAAARRSK